MLKLASLDKTGRFNGSAVASLCSEHPLSLGIGISGKIFVGSTFVGLLEIILLSYNKL
jgi:hypothetical protein